jgi:hypothetical protein
MNGGRRSTAVRLLADPELLLVFHSRGLGVTRTRKSTSVEAVIAVGAGSSKLSVSFSLFRSDDPDVVIDLRGARRPLA